ncbi:MAG: hypothetical protein DMF57_06715 [Acidobacteria bacterium]|nr:MAG: hypothetical protein DMF57_06715 [Acidobacteriota bacterium]
MGNRLPRRILSPQTVACEPGLLAAGAAWLMTAKTLTFGVNFLLPILLVRRLSVSEFGLYKQAFLIVNTAIGMLPLGFATSAFYFWPRQAERRDGLVFNILLFYSFVTGVAGLILVWRPTLLAAIFHDPELVKYGAAIGAVVLLWGASSFLETVAIANGETRLASGFIVAIQISKALFLIGAVLWSPTVGALVGAALIHGVIQMSVAVAYLGSRFGRFWTRLDISLLRVQLAYALPHGFAAWLYWVHVELHQYFVAHRFNAAVFAIYAVGCFQLPFLAILCESVGSIAIPRVSRLHKEGRFQEIVTLTADLARKLALILFPTYAFLLVTRRELITVLFTKQYLASAPILALNLTLIPLAIVLTAGDPVIRAHNEARFFLTKVRLALTGLTLAGLWFATNRFGLLGPIAVVVVVTFLERVALALKVGSLLELGRRDLVLFKDLPKLGLASAAAGLVALMAREFFAGWGAMVVLLGCALVFSVAYVALLLVSGVPTRGEREAVLRFFVRPRDADAPRVKAA